MTDSDRLSLGDLARSHAATRESLAGLAAGVEHLREDMREMRADVKAMAEAIQVNTLATVASTTKDAQIKIDDDRHHDEIMRAFTKSGHFRMLWIAIMGLIVSTGATLITLLTMGA